MRRGPVGIMAIGAVLAIGAGLVAKDKTETSRRWTRFAACMIGPPIGPKETLAGRLHALDLAASTRPRAIAQRTFGTPAAVTIADDQWPARCGRYADELDSRWVKWAKPALARHAAEASQDLRRDEIPVHADDLWHAAEDVAWSSFEAQAVVPPPKPLTPLIADETGSLVGAAGLLRAGLDVEPLGNAPFVQNSWHVCEFTPDGPHPLARLACSQVFRQRPARIELVDTYAGAEYGSYFFRYPDNAIVGGAEGGEPLAKLDFPARVSSARDIYVGKGGEVTLIDDADTHGKRPAEGQRLARVVRVRGGQAIAGEQLPVERRRALVVAGYAVYWSDTKIYARKILEGERVVGPQLELGAATQSMGVRSCRADHAYVVLVATGSTSNGDVGESDRQGDSLAIHFVTEAGWSPAIVVDPRGPKDEKNTGYVALSCSGEGARAEARLSWAQSGLGKDRKDEHTLIELRCTSEGCQRRTADVRGLGVPWIFTGGNSTADPDEIDSPLVVDLGARTLMAWEAGRTIRARLAPLEELATAPDTLIDETEEDPAVGIKWYYTELFARGDTALLTLKQYDKPYRRWFVRADGSGSLALVGE